MRNLASFILGIIGAVVLGLVFGETLRQSFGIAFGVFCLMWSLGLSIEDLSSEISDEFSRGRTVGTSPSKAEPHINTT